MQESTLRGTFVYRNGEMVPKHLAEPIHLGFLSRSATVAAPMLNLDTIEMRSMADGKVYTSKSHYRASLKAHGYREVGTEVAAHVAPVLDTFAVNAISKAELARAQAVHTAQAGALMKQPGIQGVGITSSADSPGEAALMIFVIRGVPRNPVPPVIDGVRTRIRESSRFTAGQRGKEIASRCRVPQSLPAAPAIPQ